MIPTGSTGVELHDDRLAGGGGRGEIFNGPGGGMSAAAAAAAEDDDTYSNLWEQYRMMAQVEANFRIRDTTGFDRAEYDKQRQQQGLDGGQQQLLRQQQQGRTGGRGAARTGPASTTSHLVGYPRAIKPTLPEPSLVALNLGPSSLTSSLSSHATSRSSNSSSINSSSIISNGHGINGSNTSGSSLLPAEEPAFDKARTNRGYNPPRPPVVPELCQGTVQSVSSETLPLPVFQSDWERRLGREGTQQEEKDNDPTNAIADPQDRVITICMGCQATLQGHRLATLISCELCNTVSPIAQMRHH
jgi:hypothetical protein